MHSIGLLALLAASVSATRVSTEELQNKLRLAPNSASRVKILDKADDFVFNFLNPPGGTGETVGKGGHTVGASGANFPALIGSGMAMTVGFLGPCGLNTPHTHPRATEFNIVVAGTALRSGVLYENGARFIENDVPLGSAAIFPQGAIHFEQNLGCEPAIFVAGFNNEDPGVTQIAQRFFDLDPNIVSAALGGLDIKEFAHLELPANVALGTDECLARCGIDRKTFVFDATSPFNWNHTSAALQNAAAYPTISPGAVLLSDGSLSAMDQVPFSENPLHSAVIGLAAAAGALLLGLVAALVRIFTAPKRVVYDRLEAAKEVSPFMTQSRTSMQKSPYHSRSPSPEPPRI